MTVAELIVELEKWPKDWTVRASESTYSGMTDIRSVREADYADNTVDIET